jgi:mono/diheme cytochrome c family protein
MKRASIIVLVAAALAQSFGHLSAAQAAPIDPAAMLAEGKGIAETYCSSCHAVGADGESAFKEAPPFRTLGAKYDLDNLQEALAEGIAVGHPEMPQFEFSPQASDALIAYLKSIQPKTKAQPH